MLQFVLPSRRPGTKGGGVAVRRTPPGAILKPLGDPTLDPVHRRPLILDRPGVVPVGGRVGRRFPSITPTSVLPVVVPYYPGGPGPGTVLPTETPRIPPVPTKEQLLKTPADFPKKVRPVAVVKEASWQEWVAKGKKLPADYSRYPTPRTYPGPVIQPKAKEPPMDLGQLFTDVTTSYFKAKYGATGAAPAADMSQWTPPIAPSSVGGLGLTPALDIPFVDIVGDPGALVGKAAAAGGKLVFDYLTQKWKIQRRRRRRRRLATATDIKDLAALAAVTGKGQAYREWIATHPSY